MQTAQRTPWGTIIAAVAVSRGLLFLVGLLTLQLHGRDAPTGWDAWIALSCRWDCNWYGTILEHGYGYASPGQSGATNWSFYPLLPLLVAALQALAGIDDYRAAGMLLSTTLLVVALALIHRHARLLGNSEGVAVTSVWLVAFLPQGIVFSSTYTESLFLALLAGTMVAMRQQRFPAAGLCAAALSATRSNGIFVIVFILATLWMQRGTRAFLRPWREPIAYLPLLMAPLGAFAFWTYAFLSTGDAFAMTSSVRHGWGWAWESPLSNLPLYWDLGFDARVWMVGSLFAACCTMLVLYYRWYAEFALAVVVFILVWGGVVPNSLWRYTMVLYPAWIALARALEHRDSMRLALIGALGLLGGFAMHAWALDFLVTI